MSYDDAKSKRLHRSHPVHPIMIQALAPKMTYWKALSKIAINQAKTQKLEAMSCDKPVAIKDESDEGSDEEATPKQKRPLTYSPRPHIVLT